MKYQRLSQIVVNNVIAFIQPFASKTLIEAIKTILQPCCNLTIEDVDADCVSTGVYDVTITLSPAIGFLGKGTALFSFDGVYYEGVVTEPFTVFFNNIAVTAGATDIQGYVFLPTNSDETKGVWQLTDEVTETFTAC